MNYRTKGLEESEIENQFQNCFEDSIASKKYEEKAQDKLRRTRIVCEKDPKSYVELKRKFEGNDQFKAGKINIWDFTYDANGRISIECDKPKEVPILDNLLKTLEHEPKPTISSKFPFKICGVPNILEDNDIIEQLSRRDARFKDKTLFCIVKRFRMNDAKDNIVFQALNPLKKQLKEKRHIFLGFKKYKAITARSLDTMLTSARMNQPARTALADTVWRDVRNNYQEEKCGWLIN